MNSDLLPTPRQIPAPPRLVTFEIAPGSVELAGLAVGVLLSLSMYWAGAYQLSNVLTPIMLVVIPAWGIWRMLRRVPASIWSALMAVRASSVVYLGIGGLVPIVGGEAARDHIFSLYPYSPQEGAKAHALFITGLFVLMLSVKLASLLRPGISPFRHINFDQSGSFRLGLIFVLLGFAYTIPVIATQIYWVGFVMPGSVLLLVSAVGSIGLFLLTLWAADRGGAAYLLPALLLFIQLIISLILMEKATFLMAILLVGLAMILKKFSIPRLAILAVVLATTLSILTPAIQQARIIHRLYYGDLTGSTIAERLGHQIRYLEGERIAIITATEATTFIRLHYTAPSSFVMSQYDLGMRGESIANSVYALIPRPIWPDKPLTSAIGTELNRMIAGTATSALGIVVFADLYWNFGWAGLLLLLPVGWYLWWASCIACAVVTARDWLMMPFVAVAFRIGMSMDNTFLLAWLVPAIISLLVFAMLRLVAEVILRNTKGSRIGASSTALFSAADSARRGGAAVANRAR